MDELKPEEAEALDILESMLDAADVESTTHTGVTNWDKPVRSGNCRILADDAAKLRQYIATRRAAPENKALTWATVSEKLFGMGEHSRIYVSDGKHIALVYQGHLFRDSKGKLQAPARYGGGMEILYWMPMPELPNARKPEGSEHP